MRTRLYFANFTVLSLVSSLLTDAAPKVLPVLYQPIADIVVLPNAPSVSFDLPPRYGTEEIEDNVVRFTSQSSNGSRVMDFALFANRTPITKANFLKYVTDGDYNRSIIHRSVPGFVIQGGGFRVPATGAAWPPQLVPTDAPITNEFGISNTYGTASMAKIGSDPDSATSQWFVSLGDNSANLDNQNGGFTVFARVTKDTLSSAADFGNTSIFPVYNAGGALSSIPLTAAFANTGLPAEVDYLMFTSVALSPLPAGQAGESTSLTYSLAANTNSSLVTAVLDTANQLQISYAPDSWGRAFVTVRATDSVGNQVDDNITIEVQRPYDYWRNENFSEADAADKTVSGPDVSNGEALSNLELYIHGLTSADRSKDVVVFTTKKSQNGSYFPTFEFPLFNLLSGVEYAIQKSSDMGVNDSWTTVDHQVIDRKRMGHIDNIEIQAPSVTPSEDTFYRIVFTLTE